MNTIKKTTLVAAIAAMAAFAVPSMASAAVWGPINTNKTLTSTNSAKYVVQGASGYSFECSNSTLGVHVRTPASSTLDITSASFTSCVVTDAIGCTVAVTATGLPWAATTTGSNASIAEHLQVAYGGACSLQTGVTVNGPTVGGFYNATHTLTGEPKSGQLPGGMMMSITGTPVAPIAGGFSTSWHETTNTLTLT